MNILDRISAVLVLWLPFSLACVSAIVVTFVMILFVPDQQKTGSYGKTILTEMDKVLATLSGYSGECTFSAEIGNGDTARNRFGFTYSWIKTILDKIQTGHCEGAAKKEGLIK